MSPIPSALIANTASPSARQGESYTLRKNKVNLIYEKMKLGVGMQGEEMGPSMPDRMLRMGSLESADNHAAILNMTSFQDQFLQ